MSAGASPCTESPVRAFRDDRTGVLAARPAEPKVSAPVNDVPAMASQLARGSDLPPYCTTRADAKLGQAERCDIVLLTSIVGSRRRAVLLPAFVLVKHVVSQRY